MSRDDTHPGLWALAVTAFAIGVTEFIVVGVLPAIATDLDVQAERLLNSLESRLYQPE